MNVYVLQTGVYENRGVSGIYATAEAAMAAHKCPGKQTWVERDGTWDNNRGGDYAASVWEYEVEGLETLDPAG